MANTDRFEKPVKTIIESFQDNPDRNDFERMAIFSNGYMLEQVAELRKALDAFEVSCEYRDYIGISNSFYGITKYMNSRDSYIVHNPRRD
jgi:hypothetical protein